MGTQMGPVLVNSWVDWNKWIEKMFTEHEEKSKRHRWLKLQAWWLVFTV